MTHLSASTLRSSLLLCALAGGAFLSTSNAVAQEQAVVAQIPFAFENGSQHLPAGTYRIDLTSEPLMLLRGTVANSAGFAMTIPKIASKPPQRGKIVFHRYGNRYFLSEVWIGGESTGRVCMQSRAEKHLQIAQNAPAVTNTQLALNAPAR
ncbi:MAG: hypothetical protein ABI380_12350 [Edaphobacter sp.]